jgi:hypothetical protein
MRPMRTAAVTGTGSSTLPRRILAIEFAHEAAEREAENTGDGEENQAGEKYQYEWCRHPIHIV